MESKDSYNCAVVNNAKDLLSALENKAPRILITKFYKKDFLDKTDLPLTETEKMGFELGFNYSKPAFNRVMTGIILV